ncbi:MAG: hypothetical protein EXS68_02220 [Candidatus Ryanbacteria bacterium]|nr:hypothetical protein [Candidatus Ryanbacteria bacterium]
MKYSFPQRLVVVGAVLFALSPGSVASAQQTDASRLNASVQKNGGVSSKMFIGSDGKKILMEVMPTTDVRSSHGLHANISKNYLEVAFSGSWLC